MRTCRRGLPSRRDRHRCVLPASIYWQSGRRGRSRGGVHEGAPLRRRPLEDLASTRLGSPLASTAAARWHFAHQRGQRAGRRPLHGRRPKGGTSRIFCNKPKRCRLREKRKIDFFVLTLRYRRQGALTAQHGRFDESGAAHIDDGVAGCQSRERITSGAYVLAGENRLHKILMRLRPPLEQLRHTLKQSSSRALPCTAACERRSTVTKVARARTITLCKTSSMPFDAASDATDPRRDALKRRAAAHCRMSPRPPALRRSCWLHGGATRSEPTFWGELRQAPARCCSPTGAWRRPPSAVSRDGSVRQRRKRRRATQR